MALRNSLEAVSAALRDFAMRFPHAVEEFPWGERAIKVKSKVFVFLSIHEGQFRATVKLPVSGSSALQLPFAEPTGYGLGKHGWVTATFSSHDIIPRDLLEGWIDESYRAVAPKSVLAQFEEQESGEPKVARTKPKKRKK